MEAGGIEQRPDVQREWASSSIEDQSTWGLSGGDADGKEDEREEGGDDIASHKIKLG